MTPTLEQCETAPAVVAVVAQRLAAVLCPAVARTPRPWRCARVPARPAPKQSLPDVVVIHARVTAAALLWV
jgi:hypothetical protein